MITEQERAQGLLIGQYLSGGGKIALYRAPGQPNYAFYFVSPGIGRETTPPVVLTQDELLRFAEDLGQTLIEEEEAVEAAEAATAGAAAADALTRVQ